MKDVLKNTLLYKFLSAKKGELKEFITGLKNLKNIEKEIVKADLLFFFPFWHTGGAEKVHADIVDSIKGKKILILFTGNSAGDTWKKYFAERAVCISIFRNIRHEKGILYNKTIRDIASTINKKGNSIVFGSNSKFYYGILPLLDENVYKTDLIHAFVHEGETGAEHWSLPVAGLFHKRVVINPKTKIDLVNQYKSVNLDRDLEDKILLINNKTHVPEYIPVKSDKEFIILFVGRNGPEKRVNLAAEIAVQIKRNIGNVRIVFIGNDLIESVAKNLIELIEFTGEIKDSATLESYYKPAHILLLTSSREGMPMVVLEAMAYGLVCLCTDVGGIRFHVTDGQNGILVPANEEDCFHMMSEKGSTILRHPDVFSKLSEGAHYYAVKEFSGTSFQKAYQTLFSKV